MAKMQDLGGEGSYFRAGMPGWERRKESLAAFLDGSDFTDIFADTGRADAPWRVPTGGSRGCAPLVSADWAGASSTIASMKGAVDFGRCL